MVIDPDGGKSGRWAAAASRTRSSRKPSASRRTAAAVHSFVLDHDYAWADGLICGGKMVIVTQPVRGPGPLAYFRALDRAIEDGRGFTEAVVVDDRRRPAARSGKSIPLRPRGDCQPVGRTGPSPDGLVSRILVHRKIGPSRR